MRALPLSPLLLAIFALGCKGGDETDTSPDDTVDTTDTTDTTDTVETDTGFEPSYDVCPAWQFTAPATGEYTVIVGSYIGLFGGNCAEDGQVTWSYKLEVNGADSTALTAGDDNAEPYIEHPVVDNAAGEVTLVDDTDVDTDADDGFTGELAYQRTMDANLLCDAEFALVGTEAYTGVCENCTFGFKVETTLTRDGNTADCAQDLTYNFLTFAEGDVPDSEYAGHLSQPWIGFSTEGSYAGWFGYTITPNAVAFGWTYDYMDGDVPKQLEFTGYYGGLYYYYIPPTDEYAAENLGPYETYHTVSYADGALAWDLVFNSTYYEPVFGENCTAEAGAEHDAAAGGLTATGSLQCEQDLVDEWTFTATQGQVITVSVDTADAAAFGDGTLQIIGPDGCTLGLADDSFLCTTLPE